MGFMQWAEPTGIIYGMLWRWKGSQEKKWCIELFTTKNGWKHAVRGFLRLHSTEAQILVFQMPIGEFFVRANTDYPKLTMDYLIDTLAPPAG